MIRISCVMAATVAMLSGGVAVHERGYTAGRFVLDPQHHLILLRSRPGSLDNARRFKGPSWDRSFELMRRELECRHCLDGYLKMPPGERGYAFKFFTASRPLNTYLEAPATSERS